MKIFLVNPSRKVKKPKAPSKQADIILLGFARGSYEFIRHFEKRKEKILVIDYDPAAIDHLNDRKINFLYGDVTDIEFFEEAGIANAKLVISTITDFNTNLFITSQISSQNNRTVIIPHSESPEEALQLYDAGATYVMMPHYIGSERVSNMVSRAGLKKGDFVAAKEKHLRYVQHHL